MGDELSHIGPDGRARMVDVGDKDVTTRTAVAEGRVQMGAKAFRLAADGSAKKGDPKAIAELAGIMAAKRTSDLIPLCHPLPLTSVKVEVMPEPDTQSMHVTARVTTDGKTGVEMEALTAVSGACLTLYDMLKAVDRAMTISGIQLLEKTGGESGDFHRGEG
ncbi:MAG: cyclic pyranopterin monophosphate synthase MoaC [Pseudomonadota bacterium]